MVWVSAFWVIAFMTDKFFIVANFTVRYFPTNSMSTDVLALVADNAIPKLVLITRPLPASIFDHSSSPKFLFYSKWVEALLRTVFSSQSPVLFHAEFAAAVQTGQRDLCCIAVEAAIMVIIAAVLRW